jgi:hypothetical protein
MLKNEGREDDEFCILLLLVIARLQRENFKKNEGGMWKLEMLGKTYAKRKEAAEMDVRE